MKTILIAAGLVISLGLAGCASAQKQKAPEAKPAATAAAPEAKAAAAPAGEKLACTKGTETRTLEIVKKGAGCGLSYEKGGKAKIVAKASHGEKHCVESKDKIRAKLEAAGYKCQ